MASVLENTTTGYFKDVADTYSYEVSGSVTVSSGTNRMMYASCHARGNSDEADFQWVRIYSGYTDPTSRGTQLAQFTSVLDVEADAILHAEYFILKEEDMPSNGTYTIVANALEAGSGAFQTALGYILFSGIDQTAGVQTASSVTLIEAGTKITADINPAGAGVVVENWSGDGSATTWPADGWTPDAEILNRFIDTALGARAGYNIIGSGGNRTYTRSGDFENRGALGLVFLPNGVDGGGGKAHANWIGANF